MLPWSVIQLIVDEASGDRAMHTLLEIAPYPCDRKKAEYDSIFFESEYISRKAREAGLADVAIERFKTAQPGQAAPAFGGGRLWDGEIGELWMVEPRGVN